MNPTTCGEISHPLHMLSFNIDGILQIQGVLRSHDFDLVLRSHDFAQVF